MFIEDPSLYCFLQLWRFDFVPAIVNPATRVSMILLGAYKPNREVEHVKLGIFVGFLQDLRQF